MMTHQIIMDIATAAEMHSLGLKLGRGLFGGAFIALYGDLGAGKTTLVKGIAAALNIDCVSSPTFTILNQYESNALMINHFDAYRLHSYDELIAVGFEECITDGSVIIMEWCENVPEALPDTRLEINIEGSGEGTRRVTIKCFGNEHLPIIEEAER